MARQERVVIMGVEKSERRTSSHLSRVATRWRFSCRSWHATVLRSYKVQECAQTHRPPRAINFFREPQLISCLVTWCGVTFLFLGHLPWTLLAQAPYPVPHIRRFAQQALALSVEQSTVCSTHGCCCVSCFIYPRCRVRSQMGCQ